MISEEIIKKIKSYITNEIDKSTYSSFYNLFVLPVSQIIEPVLTMVSDIEAIQSLSKIEQLSEDQMDQLSSNFLVFRHEGNTGTISCKAIVKERKELNIPQNTIFSISKDQKTYSFVSTGTNISADSYYRDIKYGDYYVSPTFDLITYTTDDGGVQPDSILKSTLVDSNIVTFVVTSTKTRVSKRETNTEMLVRILASVGEKSMNSAAGIINVLSSTFPDIAVTYIYGSNDEEMLRNKLMFFITNDEWTLHTFRGKLAGNMSVQSSAYEAILLAGEYTVSGTYIVPDSPDNFLGVEASQEDYNGLYEKWDDRNFVTGNGIILSADAFPTDTGWVLSDAIFGYGKLVAGDEIVVLNNEYTIGKELDMYDYYKFVKQLMEIK